MTGLVFGIMSAVHSPAVVSQLCEALQPYPVVIHHDFVQQADFEISANNASFVPEPKRTGWDDFAFTEGLVHLLTHCLKDPANRYFQLLSPTCLPIRSVAEFARFVDVGNVDAHVDGLDLFSDEAALMNYGHRTFAARDSWQKKVLYRASTAWFDREPSLVMRAGLQLRAAPESTAGAGAAAARKLNELAANGRLGAHIFNAQFHPWVGSTWFGANRKASEHLLAAYADAKQQAYWRTLEFADEALVPTLLHNGPLRVAAANHLICDFDDARPGFFTESDLAVLADSPKHFARKFADDPADSTRKAVLKRVCD